MGTAYLVPIPPRHTRRAPSISWMIFAGRERQLKDGAGRHRSAARLRRVLDLPIPSGTLAAKRKKGRSGMAQSEEQAFEGAMRDIYRRASAECRYQPHYLLVLIDERGAVGAAHKLLSGKASEGFGKLWELERLDLSVEALALQPRWHPLFTDEHRKVAKSRLQGAGYNPSRSPECSTQANRRRSDLPPSRRFRSQAGRSK